MSHWGHRGCSHLLAHIRIRQPWEVSKAGCMRTHPTLYAMRRLKPKRDRDLLKLQSQ